MYRDIKSIVRRFDYIRNAADEMLNVKAKKDRGELNIYKQIDQAEHIISVFIDDCFKLKGDE